MRVWLRLLLVSSLSMVPPVARAEDEFQLETDGDEEFEDFSDVSLEELLAIEVEVASRGQAQSIREAPGVLTVLTREEIQQSGARDLLDLLGRVPGFQFGTDTYSALYAGVRGLWAADGKVLVLLDGHDLAEHMYDGVLLGNRVPIDWIERLEVIRGPGSVQYGGAAELAVVNIVTRQAKDLQGMSLEGEYGQLMHGLVADDQSLAETYGRRNLSLQWGQRFPESQLAARIGLFAGQASRSDRAYTDALGQSYNLAGQAADDPLLADLALDWRGLQVRYLFERYHLTQRDGWGENQEDSLPADFTTSSLRLAYDWRPAEGWHVRPSLSHVWQKPWQTTDERAEQYEDVTFDPTLHQVKLGLVADWTPLEGGPWIDRLAFLAGAEYRYDWAREAIYGFADPEDPDNTLTEVEYHDVAAFLEASLATPWIDATLGARYEYHSLSGSSFVPRAVLQEVYGPFHWKALISQAFRNPSIMNLAYTPDVVPEKTTVYELELGLQPVEGLMFTLSGFDITVEHPIVYYWDDAAGSEGYRNYPRTGTRGLEAEIRYLRGIWSARLTYSFYDVVGKNQVDTFRVPGARHVLLGMAPHKATLEGSVRVLENLSLHVGLLFLSDQRWAYGPYDADGNAVLRELPEQWLLDAYLRYDHLFVRGLWLGFGVYNMLDQRVEYAQPYDNGHPPLPGQSLEVLLRLGYDWHLGAAGS